MTRCDSVVDPKVPEASLLYLPAGFPEPDSVKKLQSSCRVRVEVLPAEIRHPGEPWVQDIKTHGLLFLPNSYVVPGGRFNEMYGWDSYFIILGLLADHRVNLARDMVENFFFEIEHYGTVLNANRTYYLTRSQPPFLTSMILALYTAEKAAGHEDKAWLERAYKLATQDYEMWTQAPHLAGTTGLSRYFDFGDGPAPESLQDESGLRRKVIGYFLLHPPLSRTYIALGSNSIAPDYTLQVCDAATSIDRPGCDSAGTLSLSADYYKADRSMRESGFDVSFRFGPYGAATHHFAPVCLNSLLYKTEKDLEEVSLELGKSGNAKLWHDRAEHRKMLINRYLWDAKRGLFLDYNFETANRSTYQYLTTFYPLWSGLATKEQARAVEGNLKIFEQAGGLATSSENTGAQWDYPYGWAPLHLLAVEGMRHYGVNADADRVSLKFLRTVLNNFRRDGTIREKYDVVTQSSESQVSAGYKANVIGFGWTNAVFLELLHELPAQEASKIDGDSAQ
ncbi:MAG TPA: trehalase family glycosidase [Terriglobales bacterium]|nr:trehalase family glycosidase [Terriglobales bacterium]